MKTPGQKITRHLIIAWGLLIYGGFNSAQAITPAQVPLYVGISAAKPNIMLMLDSSGSMSTNVTTTSTASSPAGAPSTSVYTCNKPISGGVTPPVPMIVTSSGVPRFCATSTVCSSTNQTSFSKNKCFNNSKSYDVAYYNGSTLTGGPYTGQQLNWYFSHGVFTPGSLSTSISVTTTTTRTALAKQAAKDLITTLTPSSTGNVTVRMGLSRYNGSDGGTLLSEIKDLDSSQSETLQSQVSNIPTSDSTPLATTLSDIGKYFATGETGNLKLHPTTTNTAASVTSVFSKANGTTSHSILNSTGVSPLAAPILGYCQKSFVILISDGLPNYDREISPLLRDYTGDCATKNLCNSTVNTISLPGVTNITNPIPLKSTGTACSLFGGWNNIKCQNGTKAGRIYETGGSDYLDDVAQALYEMDLRPTLGTAKKAQIHVKNNVVTYAIGLADPHLQTQSVLSDAATVGGGNFILPGIPKPWPQHLMRLLLTYPVKWVHHLPSLQIRQNWKMARSFIKPSLTAPIGQAVFRPFLLAQVRILMVTAYWTLAKIPTAMVFWMQAASVPNSGMQLDLFLLSAPAISIPTTPAPRKEPLLPVLAVAAYQPRRKQH
ncbi:MAG: hypothetical protein QX196_05775 [Methylococcaceae bacterium]